MLRLKNSSPELPHVAPFPHMRRDFPLKPRIDRRTEREYRTVSLPQKDGTYVASVLEAPEIVVYDRSRKAAEDRAAKTFLKTPDPYAYNRHPLALSGVITVEMEFDPEAKVFVTYVKELHRISTFGDSELTALDNTVEMIRGYIRSMTANRKKIPIPSSKLVELKRLVGLR